MNNFFLYYYLIEAYQSLSGIQYHFGFWYAPGKACVCPGALRGDAVGTGTGCSEEGVPQNQVPKEDMNKVGEYRHALKIQYRRLYKLPRNCLSHPHLKSYFLSSINWFEWALDIPSLPRHFPVPHSPSRLCPKPPQTPKSSLNCWHVAAQQSGKNH